MQHRMNHFVLKQVAPTITAEPTHKEHNFLLKAKQIDVSPRPQLETSDLASKKHAEMWKRESGPCPEHLKAKLARNLKTYQESMPLVQCKILKKKSF